MPEWKHLSLGQEMPVNAVRGGTDVDGERIYVGRAHHESDLIPAKVIPGRRACWVPYNGGEHFKQNFEVLCDTNAVWVPAHDGNIHRDAIEGGRTGNGETLYIGRASHQGSQVVGKIHPSRGRCSIPFNGREIDCVHYEVLTSQRN